MMSLAFALFFASGIYAEEPTAASDGLTNYVAKLCIPGKKCCYKTKMVTRVTQDGSNHEGTEEFLTSFCVTTCADGKRKAVFQAAQHPENAGINEVDAGGLDIADHVEDLEQQALLSKAISTPLYYTLNADGSLASSSCDSKDANDCQMQLGVLKSALKEVKVKKVADTTGTEDIAQLLQLSSTEGVTTHHEGVDKRGPYKMTHTQTTLEDGKVRLLTTKSYAATKADPVEADLAGTSSGTSTGDEGVCTAEFTVESDTVYDSTTGATLEEKVTDKGSFSFSSDEESTKESTDAVSKAQFFLQTQANNTHEDKREPQVMKPAGKSHFVLSFELSMTTPPADSADETCALASAADGATAPVQLFEVPELLNLHKPRSDEKLFNGNKFFETLEAGQSIARFAIDLGRSPTAFAELDKEVSKKLAANKLDEKKYSAYLMMLASVRDARVQAGLLAKFEDKQLQATHTVALENAMSSMLSVGSAIRDEEVHRVLLKVAETSEVENIADTAILVLAGLLKEFAHHENTDTMPAWCHEMFGKLVDHVKSERFRPEVGAAMMGNTRFTAAEPHLNSYLKHDQPFVVHLALDGLRHFTNGLSPETEDSLMHVLDSRDWTNVTSQIPGNALSLLQHSMKVQGRETAGTEGLPVSSKYTGWKITIYSRSDDISKSDYHKINSNVAVSLSRASDTGNIAFTAGGAVEGKFFNHFSFTYGNGNAITDLTFDATRDMKTKKWSRGVALKVLGVIVKSWGAAKADHEQQNWKNKLLNNAFGGVAFALGDQSKQEHSICGGRFDFTQAAEVGIVGSGDSAGTGSVAMDISNSRNLVDLQFNFPIGFGFSIHLRAILSGTVGLVPAVGWAAGSTCSGNSHTTYLVGLKPYAKAELTLAASIQWLVVRAGIQATVTLINVGFPAYGRLVSSDSKPTCGSLEFEISAFDGTLAVFVESWVIKYGRRRRWFGFYSTWTRWFEFTILKWSGLYKGWQLFGGSYCRWGQLQGLVHRHHVHNPHRHHPHQHNPHRHHPHGHNPSRRRRGWGRRRMI